jgi:hypothetical protein
MKTKLLVSAILSTVLVSSASAEWANWGKMNQTQNISVGATVGNFGIGANAKYKIDEQIGVRAGFDIFKVDDYEITDDETNTKYNFDLKLQDFTILGDYHPWSSSFKTTAGLIVNSSSLDGVITPATSQKFEFQGHTYSTDDIAKVNTKVDFDPVAPYIGIGWDSSFDKSEGFGFTFDIGVIYQGSAKVDYSVRYKEIEKTGDESVDNAAQAVRDTLIKDINKDLEKEKISLQDELDKYELLPYISIGFNYKF